MKGKAFMTNHNIQKFFRYLRLQWRAQFSDRGVLWLCMLVSLIFWVALKMSQSFSNEIAFPVSYELPNGRLFSEQPPTSIHCVIKGKGWDLLGIKAKANEYPIHLKLKDSDEQVISNLDVKDQITSFFGSDITVVKLNTDYWNLELDKSAQKRIPILADIKMSFKNGFLKNKMNFSPDSIIVSGPANKLDSIDSWGTVPLVLNNLDESIHIENLELLQPDDNFLRISEEQVDFSLGIEAYTEKTISIDLRQLTSQFTVPQKVDLVFNVGFEEFDVIELNDFSLKLEQNEGLGVVNILKSPDYVRNVRVTPSVIDIYEYKDYVANR